MTLLISRTRLRSFWLFAGSLGCSHGTSDMAIRINHEWDGHDDPTSSSSVSRATYYAIKDTDIIFMNCRTQHTLVNTVRYCWNLGKTYEEVYPEKQRVGSIEVRASSQPLGAKCHPSANQIFNSSNKDRLVICATYPPYNSAVPSTTTQ